MNHIEMDVYIESLGSHLKMYIRIVPSYIIIITSSEEIFGWRRQIKPSFSLSHSLFISGLLHKFLKVERLFIMGYYIWVRTAIYMRRGHSPERNQKQFNMTGICWYVLRLLLVNLQNAVFILFYTKYILYVKRQRGNKYTDWETDK